MELHDSNFKSVPAWEINELVGDTGAWIGRASEMHHHDEGLAGALASFLEREKPQRVIDMGCGLGEYVQAVRSVGIDCTGFDGHPDTARLTSGLCYTADFADMSLPDRIYKEDYDWCVCLEVFEHVPQSLEAQLVDCMLAAAGHGLVLSVAFPGQGGLGHVNERPHEYVVNLLRLRGLELDVVAQTELRRCSRLPWFQMNTLVFRRKAAAFCRSWEPPALPGKFLPAPSPVAGIAPVTATSNADAAKPAAEEAALSCAGGKSTASTNGIATSAAAPIISTAAPVVCARCGATEAPYRCSRCMARYYCSQGCARADWRESHKAVCKAPKKEPAT